MAGTRVFFFLPDYVSGGVKMMYRHAELLTAAGFDASILHTRKAFVARQFEHRARVVYWDDIRLTPLDVVVVPEYLAEWLNPGRLPRQPWLRLKQKWSSNRYAYLTPAVFESPASKVIYNQNPYYTFLNFPIVPNQWVTPYTRPDCLGVVTVSADNESYVKLAFPEVPVHRVFYSIDHQLFSPGIKKKQIAYLTFKNKPDVAQVINLLLQRKQLHGFSLRPVSGTEREVAAAFNESMVMLNFGNVEGFGLPPAEAMLSGCVVIGYHGEAGKEFMMPDHCFPVSNGDIQDFVRTTERVAGRLHENPDHFSSLTSRARSFIVDHYPKLRERESVVAAWQALLAHRTT